MRRGFVVFSRVSFLFVFVLSLIPFQSASAAANLTITPITWNVIGLDSNNVNTGPNNFPVGARVCNTGDAPATNVSANFVWDSTNALIDLRPGSLNPISIPALNDGDCYDFYFEVEITRNAAAYYTTRRYHIDVTADLGISVSTPQPREVYVERLVSQNRNSTLDVLLDGVSVAPGGMMALVMGETYTITLVAKTATNGYEQIESFINFPNTIFQVLGVNATYSAESSATMNPPYDTLYGDACVWENDPNSPKYRSCLSTGKAGGNITVQYTVRIIGGAGSSNILNTLVYDFSGASYHYNSDFSVGRRIAAIIDPSLVTIAKNFNPDPTNEGGISKLTFTLTNPNAAPVSGVSFTDNFPNAPGAMVVAGPPNASTSGCGTPTFSPMAGSASISFSNGTIAANGTCAVSVNVTVPVDGVYNNTSGNVFVGNMDTGNNASDSLTVTDAPPLPACVPGIEIATWNFPTGGSPTNPAPSSPLGASATANAGSGLSPSIDLLNTAGAGTGSWASNFLIVGTPLVLANHQYFEFAIDTTGFQEVTLQFSAQRSAQGSQNIQLYYGSTAPGTASTVYTLGSQGSWINFGPTTLNTGLNPNGITYFRLYVYNAGQNTNGHFIYLDGVRFTGCGIPYPTLAKSFSPDPIAVGGASTLSFTVANTSPVALTDLTFTDILPAGVTVVNSGPTAVCGGGSVSTTAPDTIVFAGGSLAANTSCNISLPVTVTTAGPHTNVSGFISGTYTSGGTPSTVTNTTLTGFSTDTITAILPPTISKLFAPNPILGSGTSTLTFTIENPNNDQPLSGVAFTDPFPAGMTVASPTGASTSGCGAPVFSPTAGAGSISFSNGSIAAGETCTVIVNVTAPTAGSYINNTGSVTATINGSPVGTDTATDTLVVNAPNPSIHLLKQVSTGPTGPWSTFIPVTPGTNVYYQFTVENTGDVPISPVSLTDNTLNVSACNTAWESLTLQVADADDDDHIATCVVGPVSAQEGSHTNTATATGTYNGTPYISTDSAATYATPELTLTKNAAEAYFAVEGDIINYDYLVENTGEVSLLGPVTVTDDKTSVTCPAVNTVGDNDNYLDPGESIICTATYTVLTGDVTAGFVANTATASVDGVDSNEDGVTVPRQLPDLTVTKTNNTSNTGAVGVSFNWILTVNNTGFLAAAFTDGQTLLSDSLPAGATYGAPTPGGFTGIINSGNISCSIDGSNILTCTADGADVTIGATTGSFTVTLPVTPTTGGNLENTAAVDPNNNIAEINETNNTGSNTVFVASPGLNLIKEVSSDNATWVNNVNVPVGDPAYYRIRVQNTGNILLTGLTVDDGMAGCTLARGTDAPGDGDDDFEPGETWVYTCSVTAVAGAQTNTATADTNETPQASDDAQYFGANPGLTIVKVYDGYTDNDASNSLTAGDDLNFTITVRNTGNVSLTNVLVSDPLLTPASETCLSVAPGDTCVLTGSYTVTPSDVTSGTFNNTAAVTDDTVCPAAGAGVCQSSVITPIPQSNIFDPPSGRKTFNDSGLPELEFTMVWINDGNIAAINVQVTDDIPTGTTYVPGSVVCIPRGASTTAPAATAPLNTVGVVPTSSCGYDPATNRIQWQGSIAPDPGATDEDNAANEVVIIFRVTVNDGVNQVLNRAFARTDLNGDGVFDEPTVPGSSLVNTNLAAWNRSPGAVEPPRELPSVLPLTGFAPGINTVLPEQPASMAHSSTDIWMEIPTMRMGATIAGVPLVDGDWNVSWLGRQVGWLEGTAFPTWKGNSAVTGHVTLANGTAGPFAELSNLKWGDKVRIHAYGYIYTYQVRENKVVSPNDTSVLKHEAEDWLTLITCKDYNEKTGEYSNRISVRAVLIDVQKKQHPTIPAGVR